MFIATDWLIDCCERRDTVPGMTRNLRAALVQDCPLILHFIQELAAYERLSDTVVTDAATLQQHLFPPTGAPAAQCLLAFADDRPVGFALYFFNFSTFLGRPGLYLEDLFVLPADRGQGHGKALIVELARIAHHRGCGRLEWSVLDWNTPAITFYQHLGAQILADWRICRLDRTGIARLAT